MLRRSLFRLAAVAGVPPSLKFKKPLHERYGAGLLVGHPEVIEVPENFKWNTHVFGHKPLPRGTSGEPLHFVLSVLFYNQPCRIAALWDLCVQIPFVPLDSRRHLRQVVHQARMESWIYFERNSSGQWYIYPTRERYSEMKDLVATWREGWLKKHDNNHAMPLNVAKQQDAAAQNFLGMSPKERIEHVENVQQQLLAMQSKLRKYERTSIDYMPYTDPNGKVQFMWWYDTSGSEAIVKDMTLDESNAQIPTSSAFESGGSGGPNVAGFEPPSHAQDRTKH